MNNPKKSFKTPIYPLSKPERIWLNQLLALLKGGQKIDFKDMYARLNGKIPDKFNPATMNERIISSNGEQIRLLGIVALQKNYKFLTSCNKVIRTIKELLVKEPKTEMIDTSTIAKVSGVSLFDTQLAISLINEYGRFWRGGTYNEDGFTFKTISVSGEDNIFHQYREFTKIQDLVRIRFEQQETDKKRLEQNSDYDILKNEIETVNLYFVSFSRLEELKAIKNTSFDFTKLVKLCEEINFN